MSREMFLLDENWQSHSNVRTKIRYYLRILTQHIVNAFPL